MYSEISDISQAKEDISGNNFLSNTCSFKTDIDPAKAVFTPECSVPIRLLPSTDPHSPEWAGSSGTSARPLWGRALRLWVLLYTYPGARRAGIWQKVRASGENSRCPGPETAESAGTQSGSEAGKRDDLKCQWLSHGAFKQGKHKLGKYFVSKLIILLLSSHLSLRRIEYTLV